MKRYSSVCLALATVANIRLAYGDEALLCNSTIDQANASGIVTFPVHFPTANSSANGTAGDTIQFVPPPSWAYTVDATGDTVQSSLWYSTAGQNYSNDVGIGYDACAFVISSLPQNTIRLGQHDSGTCSSILSQPCMEAILTRTSNSALQWTTYSSPPPYENLTAGVLPTLCAYIAADIGEDGKTYPKQCAQEFGYSYKVKNVDAYNAHVTTQIVPLTGYNSSILDDNPCTLQDDGKTFYRISAETGTGTASYDKFTRAITPILSVYFSVANQAERTSFYTYAPSKMSCVRVKDFSEGSRVSPALPKGIPYSYGSDSLSGGAIAGVVVGVLAFVAIVVLLAFWLWRRRRKQAKQGKNEVMGDDSETKELGDDTKHELTSEDRKVEKDSSPISELSGAGKKAAELAGEPAAAEVNGRTKAAELP